MRIIAVGRMRGTPEGALFERYAARLRPALAITELADAPGAPAEIKRREGVALLAAVPVGAWLVALDLGGAALASADLARLIERWGATGRTPVFVLGGAEGLDGSVLARAGHVLSLGPLTWPHLLARAMLAEQLYRAQSILSGHPYHRAGRPALARARAHGRG